MSRTIHPDRCLIYVVDDHPAIVRSLEDVFLRDTQDLIVVGSARNQRDADADLVRLIAEKNVDLAIVDIDLRPGNGIDLVRSVTSRHPDFPMVVMSMKSASAFARSARDAGAKGYVEKGSDLDVMIECVRHVRCGHEFFPEGEAPDDPFELYDFSPAERVVAELTGRGLSVNRVADRLSVSSETVKSHKKALRRKTGYESSEQVDEMCVGRMQDSRFS